jgi:hypothetical protein
MTTPPARVALSKTSISILPKITLLTYTATKVLAQMLSRVLTIDLYLAMPSARAALKLGQYKKRKIVPIVATNYDL